MATAITNVLIFDGTSLIPNPTTVILSGAIIRSLSGPIPPDAVVIDAQGCTFLPGLIDAHVHTGLPQLREALKFGVTTELEMMGYKTPEQRQEIAETDDVADIRSASFGMTPPGGHPSQLHGPRGGKSGGGGGPPGQGKPGQGPPGQRPRGQGPPGGGGGQGHGHSHGIEQRHVNNPSEATKFVAARVAEGADYIKIMIEEGSMLSAPGLPTLTEETIRTGVQEAHKHNKLAIAHVLTVDATRQAIASGIDGLAHLFLDKPHTSDLISTIASSGAFVTPCLVLNASIMGKVPSTFASDPRVTSKLTPDWKATLNSSFDTYPNGNFSDCLASVKALHQAGVDILAGTDVSMPMPHLGGLAHGASVHHELQLLVEAGLTPVEALRAATSVPAKRFGLVDRGRIEEGMRADLLLVKGNPTENIGDSLNIEGVWRRGVQLTG